ncbi:MAG: UbiA family prenyltransferase [Halobacteriota archaeon]|nr:UbiA family prenyltransferase [Halobacteriota archaeon]
MSTALLRYSNQRSNSWGEKISATSIIKGLIELLRPKILAAILLTPIATAFLAVRGIPPAKESLLLLCMMTTAIGAAHSFNDYHDRDIDALNRRTKERPIVIGVVSPKTALLYSKLLMIASVVFAILLNTTEFILILIGIVMIVSYSKKLKRTRIGFIPPAIGSALLPLGAWAAYSPESVLSTTPVLIAIIGFCFELQPYWSDTISDIKGDRERNAYTIPVYYGSKATSRIMLGMYIISFVCLLYLYQVADLGIMYLGITLGLGIVVLFGFLDFTLNHNPKKATRQFNMAMGYISLISVVIILEMVLGL